MTDAAQAALSIWAIEVDLAGCTYTIPPLPATRWFLAVLDDEEPLPIVPGLLGPDDEEEILEALLGGRVGVDDLVRASRDVLATASGWNWWEADRLIRGAAAQWRHVGGELTVHGVDPGTASLGAVLGAIYALAVRNMTKEQRFTFDSQLSSPPVGVPLAEWLDEDQWASSFEAAMAEGKPLP